MSIAASEIDEYKRPSKIDFRHSIEVKNYLVKFDMDVLDYVKELDAHGGIISKKKNGVCQDSIDKECKLLCDALNLLPGVETSESCCGHKTNNYRIWFKCNDPKVLAYLARFMSHNYYNYEWAKDADGNSIQAWKIKLEWTDTNPPCYCLESPYYPNLFTDSVMLARSIISDFSDFYYSMYDRCFYS